MDVVVDVLSYKELQQVAKQVGLKANQKFSSLRKDVRKWQLANKGGKENGDVVLTPSKTPKGKVQDATTPRLALTPRDHPKNPTTPKAPSVRTTEVKEDPVPDPPDQPEPQTQPPAEANHATEAIVSEEDLKAQIYAEIKARAAERREEEEAKVCSEEPKTASKDRKSPWKKMVSTAAKGMENLEDYLARKNQRRHELMSGKKVPICASKSTPSLARTSTHSLSSDVAQTPSLPRPAPKTPTTSRGPAPKTPMVSAVQSHGTLPRNKSTGNLHSEGVGGVDEKESKTPSMARADEGPVCAAGGAGHPPRPPHCPSHKGTVATQQPAMPRSKSVSSVAPTAKANPSVPPKHAPAPARPLVPKFAPPTERKQTFGGFIDSLAADTQAQTNHNPPSKNSAQSALATRPIAIAKPPATIKGASRPPPGPPPKPVSVPSAGQPAQSERKNLKRPAGGDESDQIASHAKKARLMTSSGRAPKATVPSGPVQGVKRKACEAEGGAGDVTASAHKMGPQAKRPKFDLEASLQRPLNYVPYSGKLLDVHESYTAKKKKLRTQEPHP